MLPICNSMFPMRHTLFTFIGYTRTSTLRQEREGHGHERQADAIRGFVADQGGMLTGIYEDTASGYGANSLARRGDLQATLRHARESGAAIVVHDLSRLGRDLRLLRDLGDRLLPIFCVRIGRQVTPEELHAGILRAQAQAEEIQRATCQALEQAQKAGTKLGNRTNLPVAQRKGTVANGLRAETNALKIADHLERHPHCQRMSRRELVEHLNAAGCWNVVSERNNTAKPWTIGSLRKPLKRAREELRLREEVFAEPFDLMCDEDQDDGADGVAQALEPVVESLSPLTPETGVEDVAPEDDDPEGDLYRELLNGRVIPFEELPQNSPWRWLYLTDEDVRPASFQNAAEPDGERPAREAPSSSDPHRRDAEAVEEERDDLCGPGDAGANDPRHRSGWRGREPYGDEEWLLPDAAPEDEVLEGSASDHGDGLGAPDVPAPEPPVYEVEQVPRPRLTVLEPAARRWTDDPASPAPLRATELLCLRGHQRARTADGAPSRGLSGTDTPCPALSRVHPQEPGAAGAPGKTV